MGEKPPQGAAVFDADALLAEAQAGGPGAAAAGRRTALLTERSDPDRAIAALQVVARLEPLDPAPRLALARLKAESGDLDGARVEANAVFNEAVDKAAQARAAFVLGEIARVSRDFAAARNAYTAVMKIEDALLKSDRSDPTAARWYARARGRVAELDAAEHKFDSARTGSEGALAMLLAAAAQTGEPPVLAADIADAQTRLAALELDMNEPAPARRRLAEAIGRYEALVLVEDKEPHWRAVLADAWALAAEADYARGAPADARTAMDKALQVRLRLAANDAREAWGLAGTWRVRAALFDAIGDSAGAAESLQHASALALQLAKSGGEGASRFLVHTLFDQADLAISHGALGTANDAADAARSCAETWARSSEASPSWNGELAAAWNRLGQIARRASAPERALDAFARAVEFRRLAWESTRDDRGAQRGLAAALVTYGDASLNARQTRTARNAFAESVSLRLTLAETARGDAYAARDLAVALERVGIAAQMEGDTASARTAWEHELDLGDQMFADTQSPEAQRFRAVVEAHIVSLGGVDANALRAAALARLDKLALTGDLTERDAALRRKLWGK